MSLEKLRRKSSLWALVVALGIGRPLWAVESSERIPSATPSFNFTLPSGNEIEPLSQSFNQGVEASRQSQARIAQPEIHFPSEVFVQKPLTSSSAEKQTHSPNASSPHFISASVASIQKQENPVQSQSLQAGHSRVQGEALFDGEPGSWKYDSEGALWLSGKQARLIGEGSFGRVFEHPANSNWVVKIIHGSRIYGDVAFYEHPEFQNLEKLSKLGLAPHPVDTGLIRGIPYIVSERVWGETLETKIGQKKFGVADLGLLRGMLSQFLRSHFSITDLTPSNVMIGTTASNSGPRAYIIDAGLLAARGFFANPFIDVEDLIKDCNQLLAHSGAKYQLALEHREGDNKISLFFSRGS